MSISRHTLAALILTLALLPGLASVLAAQETATQPPAGTEAPEALNHGPSEEAAVHAEAAEGGGHETTGYSGERWRDFLYRVINFVVYVALLYFLLRGPVKKFLFGRRENVARTLEYLETQSKNLGEQTAAMRKQLDQLSQERLGILSQCERDGAKERDRIIAEANKTAEIIIQRAEATMELEIKTARQKLTAEIGELAKNLAQKEIVENITDDDRGRLVLEFVDKVVKLPARKS
jgi:F-type H+-transporting ATPase subunit b